MALVGQAVSEKKIFEIVDGRTDGRTDAGRTPDHGHPISSPCEPNGSGELKKKKKEKNAPQAYEPASLCMNALFQFPPKCHFLFVPAKSCVV